MLHHVWQNLSLPGDFASVGVHVRAREYNIQESWFFDVVTTINALRSEIRDVICQEILNAYAGIILFALLVSLSS